MLIILGLLGLSATTPLQTFGAHPRVRGRIIHHLKMRGREKYIAFRQKKIANIFFENVGTCFGE
jgi:hypothetical protein